MTHLGVKKRPFNKIDLDSGGHLRDSGSAERLHMMVTVEPRLLLPNDTSYAPFKQFVLQQLPHLHTLLYIDADRMIAPKYVDSKLSQQ